MSLKPDKRAFSYWRSVAERLPARSWEIDARPATLRAMQRYGLLNVDDNCIVTLTKLGEKELRQ